MDFVLRASVLVRLDPPRLVFYSVFRRWIEPGAIIARSSHDHRTGGLDPKLFAHSAF
jgi:hypothetical protein